MNRIQLIKYSSELESLSDVKDRDFGYFLQRNIERISQIINHTRKWSGRQMLNMKGDIKTYNSEADKIAGDHCKKNENGDPILDKFGSITIINTEAYEKDMKELNDKMPLEAAQIEKYEEVYKKLLDEDVDVDFYKIQYDRLPALSRRQLNIILPIVTGLPKETAKELAEIEDITFE